MWQDFPAAQFVRLKIGCGNSGHASMQQMKSSTALDPPALFENAQPNNRTRFPGYPHS